MIAGTGRHSPTTVLVSPLEGGGEPEDWVMETCARGLSRPRGCLCFTVAMPAYFRGVGILLSQPRGWWLALEALRD